MKIREREGPSQGVIQHFGSHERSPYAPQFEDGSHEEKNDAPTETRGKWPSEAAVLLERDVKNRAEMTLMETVRTRHVIIGMSKITRHNRDAVAVKSASSCTERLTVSLNKKPKKSGGRGSVAL